MEDPLVSIVVVSYNHSKYIRENLDSIKAQTYPNIELIVADDASRDNSVEVFEQWLAENNYPAKKNYHTKNTGLATMLNECMEVITGKYVKFIAADDFLHPHSIEKCVRKLEELGEEYGMVFSDTFTVNDNSGTEQDFADYNALGNVTKEEFRKLLIFGNRIAALTVLMRTKALKETGHYDSTFLAEDYYRWLKISEKYFIGYLPEKLAYYRLHGSNISKAKMEILDEENLLLQMLFDKEGELQKEIRKKMIWKYETSRLTDRLIKSYAEYKWKDPQVGKCIQMKVPFFAYRIIKKLKLWQN